MKRKNTMITITLAVLVVSGGLIYFSEALSPKTEATKVNSVSPQQQDLIDQTLEGLKNSTNNAKQVNSENYVAKTENFEISEQRYIFFKENMKLLSELNNTKSKQTENDLLNVLLTKEFVLQDALSKGLLVSEDEINEMVEQQKDLLYNPEYTGESKELVQVYMKKRIEITGLTDDEFWKSDLVRDDYANSILTAKLYDYLLQNKEIESYEDYIEYQNKLLRSNIKKVEINL